MAEARLLDRRDAVALARFLDEPREAFGTKVTIAERDKNGRVIGARDAHVWHCSLSLHPQEPELADERWAEIAEAFIEQMGFAGERAKAQCRWVAIRHGRSAGGSDHAHLVVTLVAEDGSKASVHNDRPRAQNACRELEQRFGLRRLEARTRQAGSRALKHGELAADRRRGRGVGERGEPRRALQPADARADRACLRDRQPRRARVRSPTTRARRPSPPPVRRGRHQRSRRLLRKTPRHRAWPARERVVRRRPPRPRPHPPRPAAELAARRRRPATGGHRVGLAGAGRAALAGSAPSRARAARADVAPLHDGAGASPPAAPRRRHQSPPRSPTPPAKAPAFSPPGRSRSRPTSPARSRALPASSHAPRNCPPTPRSRRGGCRARQVLRCSCSPLASPTAPSGG